MRIKWDDKLKIGNKLIDADHKLIISLIVSIQSPFEKGGQGGFKNGRCISNPP